MARVGKERKELRGREEERKGRPREVEEGKTEAEGRKQGNFLSMKPSGHRFNPKLDPVLYMLKSLLPAVLQPRTVSLPYSVRITPSLCQAQMHKLSEIILQTFV